MEKTIEEKAKAYDEAIETCKKVFNFNNLSYTHCEIKERLEQIFPELAESEDEKIRKWLIDYFKNINEEVDEEDRCKIVACLERQKEQKPLSTEEWELNSIAFLTEMGYTCIPPAKEQKDTECSEDERIRKELIDFIQWAEDRGTTRHDYHQAKRPAVWIAYLEKQKEQTENATKTLAKILKDSELKGGEYTIPEGMEAEIKDGKIIMREKESQDEKVRKFLLRLAGRCNENSIDFMGEIKKKDVLAYLEKQKEQKSVSHEGDSKPQTDAEILSHYLSWAENDEEECPYTWNRLAKAIRAGIDALNQTLPEADTKAFNDGVKEGRRLEREDMQKEQKPAEWSEEDRLYQDNIIAYLNLRKDKNLPEGTKYPVLDSWIAWLKSLRPLPQRRDTYYDIIHGILAMLKDMDFTQITPEHRISLLNDIRVKCKNADECAAILDEPHWEPSEEQMYNLKKAYESYNFCDGERDALESLYNDLKKLWP